ncbi:hypothetical protein A9Q99_15045 [Gammaproteobacteria bacterium 45_16_T64]|nr:hypothetical protein A9Q99_15045 [Gammaproteobacteria bacterium 45_16_T64]
MKHQLLVLLLGGLCVVSSVSAQSINQQQKQQSERLVQGVKSGELTKKEANRLSIKQAKIAKKEARFRSDGVFTPVERAIIKQDLAEMNIRLYKQKHDKQSRL